MAQLKETPWSCRPVGLPPTGIDNGVGNANQVAGLGEDLVVHRRLVVGKWNVTSLVGKERELVKGEEQYQLACLDA